MVRKDALIGNGNKRIKGHLEGSGEIYFVFYVPYGAGWCLRASGYEKMRRELIPLFD
jgi:hypothetical protein